MSVKTNLSKSNIHNPEITELSQNMI